MAPLRFVFGLHLHQPVGNFDHVFQQHLDDVYAPLIDRLAGADFLPIVLHVSGPLLEWLEAHAPGWMDRLGRLAAAGRVELLLSGRLVPMPLMPDWVQEIARFLPFQWAFYFPIESLVGDLSNEELVRGLFVQLLWILIGLAIFRVAWRFAIRRYSAVGG